MAKKDWDEEGRRRRREREEEDEAQEQVNPARSGISQADPSPVSIAGNEKLEELIAQVDPMIERVNHLYQMYLNGVEKIPPVERRKLLDQKMMTLQSLFKPTAASTFKYQAISARYQSYRDRWDKLMKDLENGKIKRGSAF